MFNKYEIENAASKIDGYYSPSPTKPGGPGVEFERAKAECLVHLRRALACAEALTVDEFMAATKRAKTWANYQAEHAVSLDALATPAAVLAKRVEIDWTAEAGRMAAITMPLTGDSKDTP